MHKKRYGCRDRGEKYPKERFRESSLARYFLSMHDIDMNL
jgi:hypothetical protein